MGDKVQGLPGSVLDRFCDVTYPGPGVLFRSKFLKECFQKCC